MNVQIKNYIQKDTAIWYLSSQWILRKISNIFFAFW